MATLLEQKTTERPAPVRRPDEYAVVGSEHGLGRNLPQRVGRKLWLPMFVMAVTGFAIGIVLAVVRANLISDGGPADIDTIASLRHFTAGFMFVGFAGVFAAVSFAIARILGEFRKGGGDVQDAAGVPVQTLKMPGTAKAFLAFMMMGMMAIVGAVVAHFIVGASVPSADSADLVNSAQWFDALEAVRRIGVGLYLFGVALGLATIIKVLRFQSVRIRELADEKVGRTN